MDIKTIVQEPLDCAAEVFNMTANIAISPDFVHFFA